MIVACQATAFTTLAWISTLQWSVQALPGIYRAVANLKPSIDRIDRFLTAPIEADRGREGGMEGVEGVAGGGGGGGGGEGGLELERLERMERPERPPRTAQPSTRAWHEEPWLQVDGNYGDCRDYGAVPLSA